MAGTELHVGPGPTRPATRRDRRRDVAADTRSVAGRPGPRTRRSINRRDAVRRRRRHRARRSIGRRCGGVAAGCATTALFAALAGPAPLPPPRSSQHRPATLRRRGRLHDQQRSSQHWPARLGPAPPPPPRSSASRRSISRRRVRLCDHRTAWSALSRRSIGRRDAARRRRRHRARRSIGRRRGRQRDAAATNFVTSVTSHCSQLFFCLGLLCFLTRMGITTLK